MSEIAGGENFERGFAILATDAARRRQKAQREAEALVKIDDTIGRLVRERDEMSVVNDQVGSPTPSRWLATATALALAKHPDAEGTWHVVAGGECSWHEFAMAIVGDALVAGLLQKAPKLIGISSRDYPTKARRPAYSRLDTSKFANDFGFRLPDWRVGVREVIGELAEAKNA